MTQQQHITIYKSTACLARSRTSSSSVFCSRSFWARSSTPAFFLLQMFGFYKSKLHHSPTVTSKSSWSKYVIDCYAQISCQSIQQISWQNIQPKKLCLDHCHLHPMLLASTLYIQHSWTKHRWKAVNSCRAVFHRVA